MCIDAPSDASRVQTVHGGGAADEVPRGQCATESIIPSDEEPYVDSSKSNIFTRNIVVGSALHYDVPVATAKLCRSRSRKIGGTKPVEFERDIHRALEALIEQLLPEQVPIWQPHLYLVVCPTRKCSAGLSHMDTSLRQFGQITAPLENLGDPLRISPARYVPLALGLTIVLS